MDKILIVDDEERLLTLYSSVLRKAGFEVFTARDARKALELAISAQPRLILLDVMMPAQDGGDAFTNLAGDARTRDLPVIFLTSLVKEDEVDAAHGVIGGRRYVSKSTPMPKFVDTVKAALSGASRGAPARA